jgi:hypothetical protein
MINAARSVVLLLLAGGLSAQTVRRNCLEYEPSVVHLVGRIERQTFPGPPNYSSTDQGDEHDVQWILHLSNTVCVNGKPEEELNSEAESNVAEIQLVIANDGDRKRYAPLIGKIVQVKGTLFHSHTAHHRTPVLVSVRSISAHSKN